jgi:hypothetical protein
MPDIVKVETGNPFEERGSYSRLVAVDNLIFVSNTAGRNPPCPPLGSAQYKVEIEIAAYRGASTSNVKEINLAR